MLKLKKNTGFTLIIIIVVIALVFIGIFTLFFKAVLDSRITELPGIYETKEECENNTGVTCNFSKCGINCPPNLKNVWRPFGNRLNASSSDASNISTGSTSSLQASSVQDWKTYRNEKYGFEFKYPSVFGGVKEYGEQELGVEQISISGQIDFFVGKNPDKLSLVQWFNKNFDANGKLVENQFYGIHEVQGGSYLQMNSYPTEKDYTPIELMPLGYNYLMPDSRSYVLTLIHAYQDHHLYDFGYGTIESIIKLQNEIASTFKFFELKTNYTVGQYIDFIGSIKEYIADSGGGQPRLAEYVINIPKENILNNIVFIRIKSGNCIEGLPLSGDVVNVKGKIKNIIPEIGTLILSCDIPDTIIKKTN